MIDDLRKDSLAKHDFASVKCYKNVIEAVEALFNPYENIKENAIKNSQNLEENKMDIVASICNNFDRNWQLYSDGRLVIEDKSIAVSSKPEWKGINNEGHEEYENIDEMLISWLPFLKENDFLGYFEEEISFIEKLQHEKEENNLEL